MEYTDITYEKKDGVAWMTINRPKVYNAFRNQTIVELLDAFHDAWMDMEIGVCVLTGAGEKAFCTGGDQGSKDDQGYEAESPVAFLANVAALHNLIRNIPKPVIAAVNGYAIGGGHVLHVVCDLTIASATAKFGQAGPKVGSVDPGWGTAFLARAVGEKKAREIWYLCKQYTAQEAMEMGLVNKVVPPEELRAEVEAWCADILAKSPTAIRLAKQSFNADSANVQGIAQLGFSALELFYTTPESVEGMSSFKEKRKPEWTKYRRNPRRA